MSAYSDKVIADGATNYWRLGEPSGTTAVDVIGGKNGTISGGVTLGQAGAVSGNTAMAFDGTTGKIVTPSVVIPRIGTIEAWIKTTTASTRYLLSNRLGANTGKIAVGINANTLFLYNNAGGSLVGASVVTNGQWHHVVFVTADVSTPSLYVDGVVDSGGSWFSRPGVDGTGPAGIGWDEESATFWLGSLDDIAIYPLALTAPEIAAHYTIGTTPATLTGDRTTAWAYHLKPLAPPKNESERAALLGQGLSGGTAKDLTTLVSAFLDQGN